MQDETNCGIRSTRLVSLVSILLATNLFALSQAIPSERTAKGPRSPLSHQAERSETPSSFSVFNPVKPQRLEETYHPITPSQRLRWFVTGTVGPAHLAGGAFVSACGTAVNRPGEYGPHWTGFADRLGISVAGSALGNAMEASGGLVLREDPRYFRVPQQPFRARVGNVVRLTLLARSRNDGLKPAYARYVGVFGSNFLSNTWRVRSEANAQDALLRSSEGLAGRMAANAFGEFWPDLKKYFSQSGIKRRSRGQEMQSESRGRGFLLLARFANSRKVLPLRAASHEEFSILYGLAVQLPKKKNDRREASQSGDGDSRSNLGQH